jgi:hypothetical protein
MWVGDVGPHRREGCSTVQHYLRKQPRQGGRDATVQYCVPCHVSVGQMCPSLLLFELIWLH